MGKLDQFDFLYKKIIHDVGGNLRSTPYKDSSSYRPLPKGLAIQKSNIDGQGLFTNINLEEGIILCVSHLLIDDLDFRTPIGAFLNHSDDENCKLIKEENKIYLVTAKNIKSDSELTVKYGELRKENG